MSLPDRARALHDSPWEGVFYLAGGGTNLLAEVLGTSGASRTVLDVRIPYSEAAMAELLGARPEQTCSEATARALAMNAFQQARKLGGSPAFGLGCTASLATDRKKKGEHRAHAAIQTAHATFTSHWQFDGDRESEEAALTEGLWSKLAHALQLPLEAAQPAGILHTAGDPAWQALILGDKLAHVTAPHDGSLLLPGAFNPLHQGHRKMLAIAEEITGLPGAYELSVANVDKPFLDYREIESRLAQFDRPVWLTHLPTFLQKARQFPGAWFALGVDTLLRLTQTRYYGNNAVRDQAIAELIEFEARFVVFGRQLGDDFIALSNVRGQLPEELVARCVEVSEAQFNNPVSSTALRTGPG